VLIGCGLDVPLPEPQKSRLGKKNPNISIFVTYFKVLKSILLRKMSPEMLEGIDSSNKYKGNT
jgi:hypothetical protein